MRIFSLSHSYPTTSKPWITPFILEWANSVGKLVDLAICAPTDNQHSNQFVLFGYQAKSGIGNKALGSKAQPGALAMLFFILRNIFAAYRACKNFKPEILHAHWALPSGFVAWVLSRLFKLPFVITVHGRDVLSAAQVGYDIPNRPVFGLVIKLLLSNAACVVCASEVSQKAVLKIAPKAKVRLIPIGHLPVLNRTNKERSDIIFVGDLVPVKGAHRLIEAVRVSPQLQSIAIKIIGDGELADALKDLVKKYQLTNISFLGYLTPSQMQQIYSCAKVLAWPSIVEGFGVVLLEALANEVSIVGTSTGVLAQLARLYPEVANIVDTDNPASFANSLNIAFNAASVKVNTQQFSWDNVGQLYQQLFKELLDNERY